MFSDTILAISSPPAAIGARFSGVRGIVRLSGDAAWALARDQCGLPASAGAGWHAPLALRLWSAPVPCAVLLFKGPRSFTGQDIAELHLPNSPAILRAVIDALLAAAGRLDHPLRLAGPGEFSARAFFNGKIDLTRAEGIAATIAALDQTQLRAAASLREGNLHREISALAERVADLLARVEAGIDFADEEGISFVGRGEMEAAIAEIGKRAGELVATSLRIDRPDSIPAVVFVGRPNVGKSSLINALARHERSIVSDVPGTTRDILSAILHTPRGDLRLIDVPGEEAPSDSLRAQMMESRRLAMLDADVIVHVFDPATAVESNPSDFEIAARTVFIRNKCDLLGPGQREECLPPEENRCGWVSAKTGENLDALRALLMQLAIHAPPVGADAIALNGRHRRILLEFSAAAAGAAAIAQDEALFGTRPELLAAELRNALDLLGQITGSISPDDVLGRIFSQFCIGK